MIRKALYMSERAVYLLRRKAYETHLTESEIVRNAVDIYLAIGADVISATERLAVAKGIKPGDVVSAALAKQIPQKYFNS